jgi:hypothetical protein
MFKELQLTKKPEGKSGRLQQEIAAACKGARPNHVGAALARHKRAGLIEERDGKLYAIPSTRTDQQAAL